MAEKPENSRSLHRRRFLGVSAAAGAAALTLPGLVSEGRAAAPQAANQPNPPPWPQKPTQFQIACMTLPYSDFTFDRALEGIRKAGYTYVAWGTTHRVNGKATPVVAADAAPKQARDLAQRCRDAGLEPLMMFSGVYPEANNAVQVLTSRIHQASAAKIPQVLTFGHTK